jgi:hypothetical protein
VTGGCLLVVLAGVCHSLSPDANFSSEAFSVPLIAVLRCAANGAGRRGETVSLTLKYWQRILRMDNQELVKKYCDWQKDNIKSDS